MKRTNTVTGKRRTRQSVLPTVDEERAAVDIENNYSGNRNTRSDLKCTDMVAKSMALGRGF